MPFITTVPIRSGHTLEAPTPSPTTQVLGVRSAVLMGQAHIPTVAFTQAHTSGCSAAITTVY